MRNKHPADEHNPSRKYILRPSTSAGGDDCPELIDEIVDVDVGAAPLVAKAGPPAPTCVTTFTLTQRGASRAPVRGVKLDASKEPGKFSRWGQRVKERAADEAARGTCTVQQEHQHKSPGQSRTVTFASTPPDPCNLKGSRIGPKDCADGPRTEVAIPPPPLQTQEDYPPAPS